MNRKRYSLFLIIFFILVSVVRFSVAATEFVAEVVFPDFVEATVIHEPAVDSVSSVDRVLNISSLVDLGSYKSVEKAEMWYYFDNDKSSLSVISSKERIYNRIPFYIQMDKFGEGYNSINYQVKITLKKDDGSIGYAYWPQEQSVSSDTFHSAIITNSTSTVITVADGGSLTLISGNQQYPSTNLTVPADALSGDTTVTITQLPPDNLSSDDGQAVAGYDIFSDPEVEINSGNSIKAAFFYGIETSENKFELKYRKDEASDWETVSSKLDSKNKTIIADITKFGQYAVFVSKSRDNNSYRPEKRVKVKSRISTYGGFKFNNLKEGDVVKIYTINGKKIAELTSGDSEGFVWNGKKGTNNGGDWAESGTYIYQIKVKDKGELISGTIAFVW